MFDCTFPSLHSTRLLIRSASTCVKYISNIIMLISNSLPLHFKYTHCLKGTHLKYMDW